jgi:hypothetical protein
MGEGKKVGFEKSLKILSEAFLTVYISPDASDNAVYIIISDPMIYHLF